MLQQILKAADNPDWRILDRYAVGVPLGVDVRLPRTPAVFEQKKKWRLASQASPAIWEQPSCAQAWRDNYTSAKTHIVEVDRQLKEHHNKGLALQMAEEEFHHRWLEASVTSLGAVTKTGASGETKDRIVYDATHGIDVNGRIRVRDQDRCPSAADIKRVQRAQASLSRETLGLTAYAKDGCLQYLL